MALVFVYVLANTGSAFAVPSYSIANVPSDIVLGEVFTVDVVLYLDGMSSIGHEMSVSFTPGLLIASEVVESGVPPYQMNLGAGVRGIDNQAGIVDQFEAASFASASSDTSFIVGQITFEAGDIGEATIVGFFDTGAALLDEAGLAVDGVVFNSVSVNVIPAPTATPTSSPICQEPPAACRRNRECCSGFCAGKGSDKTCQSDPTPTPSTSPIQTPTATPTATPNETPNCQEPPAACRKNRDCCSNVCAGKGSSKTCQPGA